MIREGHFHSFTDLKFISIMQYFCHFDFLSPIMNFFLSISSFSSYNVSFQISWFLIPCCLVFLTSRSSPPWKQFPTQVVRDTVRVLRLKYKTLARAFTQKNTSKKSRLDLKNIRYQPKDPCQMSIPKISMILLMCSINKNSIPKRCSTLVHWCKYIS